MNKVLGLGEAKWLNEASLGLGELILPAAGGLAAIVVGGPPMAPAWWRL